ncbi:Eukaryotic translation initiation factor 3 subunit A [Cyberlindnera fabianii]|uniref:Eukaryotic translation initiation factor 3 subunit A n=1 Tax=Cyberlindnera fabianii TaxID=36022 RepID=A0A1V2L419_CYBFA|nr:Eukaryotic translation initiation factor 3 subunit A [Cyberlindnera fabianii]
MAPPVIRPDNVLKRAEELLAVGKDESALQIMHEFLTSKKTRSVPPQSLEPIALLFVSLAVDLRKGFTLKDGLHQFKKNVQNSDVGLVVIENVSRKLVELAEKKLEDAQAKADEVNYEDDLEVSESPEDIMLSAVSNEQSKDRADRELVTPVLRFLWESYRLVLDLLRNNARVEVTYSDIVQQAYQFCLKFNRKTEFRRLSELIRTHIQSAAQPKPGQPKQANAIDLQDPETMQRYLDLRFNQLNVSVKLELWQEAYRSVEDIYTLIRSSKRPPKPIMMVSYYENLAKIFLVADNGVFHAAAWYRFFNLYSQSPNATEEQLSRYASIFLLSALAVPQDSFSADDNEQYAKQSNQRLASLLNLPKIPTRASLLEFGLSKTVYDFVDPSVKKLYKLLESDFHPLSIRDELKQITKEIESNSNYAAYVKPLTKVITTRLFEQISQVYESVKLDFLIQLATFEGAFELSPLEIEGFLLNAGRDGLLSFHIDHDAEVIVFRSDPFEESINESSANALQSSPADLIRSQLSNLAKTLYASVKYTDPSYAEKQKALRDRLLASATAALVKEREEIERSRKLQEERDLQAEKEKKEREAEAIKLRQQKIEEARVAEAKRVEEETKRRAMEKLEREKNALLAAEKKRMVEEINAKGIIKLDINNLDELDAGKIHLMQIEQLEKDKKETESRVQSLFKRIDHTERAYRKYELPLLEKDASVQTEKDRKLYEEVKAQKFALAKKDHENAISLRDRLKRIVPEYESFKNEIDADASAKRAALIKEQAEKLEAAKKERLEQIRQQRYEQALAEYEQAKAREAELEARRIAEEKRAAEEEMKREKLRKEREEREAINRQMDEKAALQRQRDAEIEARLEAQRSGGAYKPPASRGAYRPPVGRQASAGPGPSSGSPSPAPTPRAAPAAAEGQKMSFAEKMRLKREGRLP